MPWVRLHGIKDYYGMAWLAQEHPEVLADLRGQIAAAPREEAAAQFVLEGRQPKRPLYDAEAAIMLRFGQMTADEYFVSEGAARAGVAVSNHSRWEPMVVLKHFGPNHPAMPRSVRQTQS